MLVLNTVRKMTHCCALALHLSPLQHEILLPVTLCSFLLGQKIPWDLHCPISQVLFSPLFWLRCFFVFLEYVH